MCHNKIFIDYKRRISFACSYFFSCKNICMYMHVYVEREFSLKLQYICIFYIIYNLVNEDPMNFYDNLAFHLQAGWIIYLFQSTFPPKLARGLY